MLVKVAGNELSHLSNTDIEFNYDAVSDTFSFTCPFFGESYFKPLTYPSVQIYSNKKKLLLNGNAISHSFSENPNANEISISGYSKTGVLDDCPNAQEALDSAQNENDVENAPEKDGQSGETTNYSDASLLEIAKKLTAPFGIGVEVSENVKDKLDELYESTAVQPDDSVASYLGKLATYKNVVLRSTLGGNLLFTQVDVNANSKIYFSIDVDFVTDIKLSANGQNMHSILYSITRAGLYEDEQTEQDKSGEANFVQNPLVKSFRPTLKVQGTEVTRITDVCKAMLAEELKNITIIVECRGWDIIDEAEVLPGDMCTVYAPKCFITSKTKMLIRNIKLTEDAKGKKSTVTCVLPETMTGDTPKFSF